MSPAPSDDASSISAIAFFSVASRSRKTGVAWTEAAFTFCIDIVGPTLSRMAVGRSPDGMVLQQRRE
jgi:hypothetical protein